MDCSEPETGCDQANWLMLKSIRAKFNAALEEEGKEFIRQIYPLINDWKGQYPNLRDIFRSDEVDWLLLDSMDIWCEGPNNDHGRLFVIFVTRSGYKDEPIIGEDGKTSLRRDTAVHAAYGREFENCKHQVCWLFRIYDKFHVNYIDDSGLSHFHVACKFDCEYVVGKFIELGQDPNLLVPKTGDSPLHLALVHNCKGVVQLLLESGADPNLTNKNGWTPLHLIARNAKDDDNLAKMLFELSNIKYQPVHVNAQNKSGNTPLHLALRHLNKEVVKFLLRRGAHSNLANEEGFTPLHYIGQKDDDGDLTEIFFKINEDIQQSVQIDARDKDGNTPLHLALNSDNKKAFEILLKKGADPNCADEDGWTALHFICQIKDNDFMELLFKFIDDMQQSVQIDSRDKDGDTPLHWALENGNMKAAEILLRRGANPNSANEKGSTPLHTICSGNEDDDLVDNFFKIIEDTQQTVQIDARDTNGRTPLHLSMFRGNKKMVESLLRRGSNPNLTDEDGWTALHFICLKGFDGDLMEMFFKINDQKHQMVQVNVRSNWDYTPLQLAVSNLLPWAVDILLDRGADLSNFVFPEESYFGKNDVILDDETSLNFNLRLASAALAVVERLEIRGYELERSDTLTIMKFLTNHGVFKNSVNDQLQDSDENLVSKAKKILMNPSMSFYELVQSQTK